MNKKQSELINTLLWLIPAIVILVFSNGNRANPLAAWVGPVLLLRAVRLQKPLGGYILATLAIFIASSAAWYGVIPMPLPAYIITQFAGGLILALPYVFDKLIARRLSGVISTLVFPSAVTSLAFLWPLISGKGSWGSIAYTQHSVMPLVQIVSVTGIYGIVFMIYWFASTVNYSMEKRFEFSEIRGAAGLFICVLIAVVSFGYARIMFEKDSDARVKVATVTVQSDIRSRAAKWLESGISPFNIEQSLIQLESQTVQAAAAGAKIVAWQEYGDFISYKDIDLFTRHAQKVASERQIYLLACVAILDPDKKEKGENVAILVDPEGAVRWKYLKINLIPHVETPYFKKTENMIPSTDTPFGRMASAICFDFDHTRLIRSAAGDISIFLAPSFDWKEITPLHSDMAVFRCIENGFSMLRPAGEGLSVAADCYGRIIASQNWFTSGERIMLAELPVKRVSTLYSIIGDAFAWVCVMGLIVLALTPLIKKDLT